jgi:cellulose synthase/poly-beta-1,6-N-acetylglucosamine synthase-like glycosyltransferase
MGWGAINGLLIISGAFGLFKREIVMKVGGYKHDTVGEDMELVVRMHRHCLENDIPYRVEFVPDPVCWTEAPETLKVLGRLAEASIALGLLTVGAALRIRGSFGDGGRVAAAWFMAAKLLVMPAAALVIARSFGLTGVYFDIAVAFAALPTASSAYILTQRMGGDGARVAWLISATTLAAMLTLPAWLAAL